MGELEKILAAIPQAAANPYSLVSYVVAVAAWTFVAFRVKRHVALLNSLEKLPETGWLKAIKSEMGGQRWAGRCLQTVLQRRIG